MQQAKEEAILPPGQARLYGFGIGTGGQKGEGQKAQHQQEGVFFHQTHNFWDKVPQSRKPLCAFERLFKFVCGRGKETLWGSDETHFLGHNVMFHEPKK